MNYAKELSLKDFIKQALKEDIGQRDITTESLIPKSKLAKAILLAKENCIVCGLGVAALVFKTLDKNIRFKSLFCEGASAEKGEILAVIKGEARGILTAERVALNFVSRLSGIATLTRKFVQATRPYKAKIMDTRKTTPALRALEKYAVRIGGGLNHRFSLDEMIMVKDNHLKVMGDKLWVAGFKEIKNRILRRVKIEIEVNNLREFKKALNLKPDIIMLDNMNIKDLKMAVRIRNNSALITPNPSPKLEASGGINLKNVRKIASLGIDMISVGDLTHSPKSIDMSLQIL